MSLWLIVYLSGVLCSSILFVNNFRRHMSDIRAVCIEIFKVDVVKNPLFWMTVIAAVLLSWVYILIYIMTALIVNKTI